MQYPNELESSRAQESVSTVDRQFLADVQRGLRNPQKFLLCKYLYDERGSQLFDRICELDEYYLTRTEAQITADYAWDMAACIGPDAVLVEYGSGSSVKTRVLLDQLDQPQAYLPVDISQEHLLSTAQQMQTDYPELEVRPIVADFTSSFVLPSDLVGQRICVYFPGSTIGNLEEPAATHVLGEIALQCGADGSLLIGFDLQKSKSVLELAYDDPWGVTASFTLNILQRMNRELDASFNVAFFEHVSFYNASRGRVEIYIESTRDQQVELAGQVFHFTAGERILVEYSHKYTIDGFSQMARKAGWKPIRVWTDPKIYFAVMHLRVDP